MASRYAFLVDTYATEILKVLSVWSMADEEDLDVRPRRGDRRGRSLREHMVHQCQSENGWFANMFSIVAAGEVLPAEPTKIGFLRHYAAVAEARAWTQHRSRRVVQARASRGAVEGGEPHLTGLWPLDEGIGARARNAALGAPPSLEDPAPVEPGRWVLDGPGSAPARREEAPAPPEGDADALDAAAFEAPDDDEAAGAIEDAVRRGRATLSGGAPPDRSVLARACYARVYQLATVVLQAQRPGGQDAVARRLRADADDATRLLACRPRLPAALDAAAPHPAPLSRRL